MKTAKWLIVLGALGCTDKATDTAESCDPSLGCAVAEELPGALLCARAPAPNDVWMVGSSPEPADGTGPYLLDYDGQSWTRHDTTQWAGGELWWAWIHEEENIFVGDQGLILEMDRATGEMVAIEGPSDTITFFGVWGASTEDVWAVGMTDGGQGTRALWRRQAGVWAEYVDPDLGIGEERTIYMKVDGTAADDVWFVGSNGLSVHYDGTSMTEIATDSEASTGSSPLLTVETRGPMPVAVGGAGNAILVEYDGSIWKDKSPAFQPSLNGVCGFGNTMWAVGQNGSRSQRLSDGTWVSDFDQGIPAITYEDWHGCDVSTDGSVWSVGGKISSRPLTRGVIGYQGDNMPALLELD